jgi:hypothetical protein
MRLIQGRIEFPKPLSWTLRLRSGQACEDARRSTYFSFVRRLVASHAVDASIPHHPRKRITAAILVS